MIASTFSAHIDRPIVGGLSRRGGRWRTRTTRLFGESARKIGVEHDLRDQVSSLSHTGCGFQRFL